MKCQHFIELIRAPFEESKIISDISPLLSTAQELADIYCEYKLSSSKQSTLRLIFSLFLFIGKKHRSQLTPLLGSLFQEENRSSLSDKVLQNLILYLGERPFSNVEMIVKHSYSLLEEMYSRADLFPSSLLVSMEDFI